MENAAKIVFECPFDSETLGVLQEIRSMRVDVVKRQLAYLEETQIALHEHRQEHEIDMDAPSRDELRQHLLAKLAMLESRLNAKDFFADEIEFYISLLADA